MGSMGSMIGNYGNGIVVNHFFGTLLNAAMGVANQLNGMLLVFSNQMIKALNPVIVKNEGAEKHDKMLLFTYFGCKYSFLLLAIFAVPFLIETPFILKVWLKNVPEWTVLFTRLQIIRTLLELLTSGLGTSLGAVGKIKGLNIMTFVVDLSSIASAYILFRFLSVPPYWIYIVAIFFMVGVYSIFKLHYASKYCSLNLSDFIHYVLLPSLVSFGASLAAGFTPLWLLQSGATRFCITTILSFAIFLTVAYSYALSTREKLIIKDISSKLLKYKNVSKV